MKWTYKEPVYGDMIRVGINGIYHFGIYVSDDEVIQFGLPPCSRAQLRDADVEVLASDIDAFLVGGFLEVCEFDRKEKKANRTPEQTVAYARSKMGMRGYSIIYNNCEHFANECVTGKAVCRQAEDVRALFRKMPVTDVYFATLPAEAKVGTLENAERMRELDAVSNEKVRLEKYYVWKLLCYALERSFGMRGKKLSFTKEKWGGWSVDGAELSLSHSNGVLAVAVSRAPVGIDVERVSVPSAQRVAQSILNEGELAVFNGMDGDRDEWLIRTWTAKEAIFKTKKEHAFIPKECDTLSQTVKSDCIEFNGERFIWSVATETPEKIRVFNVEL